MGAYYQTLEDQSRGVTSEKTDAGFFRDKNGFKDQVKDVMVTWKKDDNCTNVRVKLASGVYYKNDCIEGGKRWK